MQNSPQLLRQRHNYLRTVHTMRRDKMPPWPESEMVRPGCGFCEPEIHGARSLVK